MRPRILSFSDETAELARRIAAATGGRVHQCRPEAEDARILVPRLFADGAPVVGICAAAILIRLLAPHLRDKQAEPPVLAVSRDGSHIVPLLGGHRGANALAKEIADALGGAAALTTASDVQFLRSLDDPPEGWILADGGEAKPAMIAVLAGARIALDGYAPWLEESGYGLSSMGQVRVLVTPQRLKVDRGLVYHPRVLIAGVGCERGTPAGEIIGLIELTLGRENLAPQSLAAIASIDIKADEPGLHAAARHFGVPLRLYTAAELERERFRLVNPSRRVEQETGTPGVAEAAAVKAGALAVPKHKSRHATCAIGRAPRPIDPEALGRPPGVLHVVGVGPGEAGYRTAAAVSALDASSDWVGYGLYLDLVADLRFGQTEHRFELGEEERRARHALALADAGKTVSLVCSGDAQIYAMAALVFDLIGAEASLLANVPRVLVEVHPGISAFQAASAKAGALLGHDFCCLSLSDLLTPREDILARLEAAASADFVTALYNPRSSRRHDLLEEAKRIFLLHRPASTPVVVGSRVGRADEHVAVVSLFDFDPRAVDMLTVVLIGASYSRIIERAGQALAFTPRGYERRR